MIDLLKKTAFVGLGVAAFTKDKVEEIAKDFIAKGTLSEQEGQRFVDEILEKSQQTKNDVSNLVEEKVELLVAKMDLVKKSDYDDVVEQVAVLRAELNELKEKVCSCPKDTEQ